MPGLDTSQDLCALFAAQAQATPAAVALEDETRAYTYAQLDAAVEQLARRLRRLGVVRDSAVGVLLPRGADYVVACLAALRAGGAFLVLELAYPADLLRDVLDDSRPPVVVTCRAEQAKVDGLAPLVVVDDDESASEAAVVNGGDAHALPPLPAATDLDRLCFIAYSSGTTGKPKGIANPHRAPVLSYDLRFAVSDLAPGDRVACNVFFVWEILRPLLRGATVVTVPDEVSYDPVALVDLLAAKRITETLMTPTLLATVLSRHARVGERLPHLRTLWLNGEVVTTDLARRGLKALPKTRLLNCYSACETHEIACGDIAKIIDLQSPYCPVGPPVLPEFTYVLDDSGKKVAPGVSGELFLGGPMLARGYLNLPETTALAFTADPFNDAPGARMYRTGDLARLLPNGNLEITGRVGAMIKLRGYSVVPAKVETAIVEQLAVHSCALISHGDGLERQLVAYIVRDREHESKDRPLVEIDESGHSPHARRILSPFLTQYMIPTLWVELDELPTQKTSGKVDLKRLPAPPKPRPLSHLGSGVATPQDPVRIEDIAEAWSHTLSVPRNTISKEHTFFDVGGHSLSLASLASRLSKTYDVRIPVARLADPATLQGHLQTVRAIRDGHTAAVQAELPSVLRADSVLDDDIQPPLRRGAKICPANKAKTIILTGATGFLGAFLLNELLMSTSAHILCLVRFNDASDDNKGAGISKLRHHLLDMGLWHDQIMERVEILPGDLSQKRLGLSPPAFEKLAHRVQVIVHAGALVNLVYPYAALRSGNVGGTREILRLAAISGATVQYVSTNGVLPPSQEGWSEDTNLEVDLVATDLADGYGQTKWVAEQLVYEAARRGLPVKIHRAGTISGHSLTGAANAWDLLSALIVESIHLGYAPEVQGWRAEMTPVDFVAKAILHLSNQVDVDQQVFHLGDPNPIDMNGVFDALAKLGYPTQRLPFDEWVTLWNDKRSTHKGGEGNFTVDILRSGMPSVEFLRDIIVLNNAKTRPFRSFVERPKVDVVLLETYTRHWFARGWLPRAPVLQHSLGGSAQAIRRGPLSGKVAVVIGASSGIGSAVSVALAREGCHVALAARRLDALEALKRRLAVRDSKIIIRKTDVTSRAEVELLMRDAKELLGPIDILVSCAGVMYFTMMANTHTEEWDRTVDVNCKGLLHCLSSTVPDMLKRGSGHIVAISSDAGRKVFPGLGVYSASKFFVEATLQSLRLETAGKGLRVSAVQPGNTATDLLGMSTDQEAVKAYGQPSGAQILDPEDVAGSIIYALKQPPHVSVNEILIEPRDEPI